MSGIKKMDIKFDPNLKKQKRSVQGMHSKQMFTQTEIGDHPESVYD